jgi:hypothetical protein
MIMTTKLATYYILPCTYDGPGILRGLVFSFLVVERLLVLHGSLLSCIAPPGCNGRVRRAPSSVGPAPPVGRAAIGPPPARAGCRLPSRTPWPHGARMPAVQQHASSQADTTSRRCPLGRASRRRGNVGQQRHGQRRCGKIRSMCRALNNRHCWIRAGGGLGGDRGGVIGIDGLKSVFAEFKSVQTKNALRNAADRVLTAVGQ